MKKFIKIFKYKLYYFLSFLKKIYKNSKFRKAYFYNYYSRKDIKNNYVLYESFHGTIFGGNPYAIFKYLVENDEYNNLYHIITVKDINHPIAKRYKNHPRVKVVLTNSREYIKYLETCKYIINNTTFRPEYIKRENQIYINTWHATLLKSLGAHTNRVWEARNLTRNFLNSDILITPNLYTRDILLDAYYIKELYNGKLTDIGYPRNDMIFNADKSRVRKIMEIPNNKKVVLYAPTWRGEINKPKNILKEYLNYYNQIKEKLNDEYVIYLKLHSMVYRYIKEDEKKYLVPFDVDTNEILSVTDVLITDYSGIMFDYMITKKPIILFQFDIDYYVKDRGDFYLPIDSIPVPIYYDIDNVCKAVNNINKIFPKFIKKYQEFSSNITYAEKGTSCKQLCEYVFLNKKNKKIVKNNINYKQKILFCISTLKSDKVRKTLLDTLDKIDYNKYTVTLLFKDFKIEQKEQLLINKNVNLLYMDGEELYSFKEYIDINTFIKCGNFSKKIEKELKNFSYKNINRFVYNLKFDIMINYCSKHCKFNILSALGISAKRKIIISNYDLDNIKSSKKAYKISLKYYDETYVYKNDSDKNVDFILNVPEIELSSDKILNLMERRNDV